MRIDFPRLPVAPPTPPPRSGASASVTALRPLPAAPPPDAAAFGARLVESLLRSLSGSAAPPQGLQLHLQWRPAAPAPYGPPAVPPAAASTLGETLMLHAQLPVLTADGRVFGASLSLVLLPRLRQEHADLAARLEAALAAASLPSLKAGATVEALRGQELQFQWTDPRALWPLQTLAMRGLLRFTAPAEERDRRAFVRAPPDADEDKVETAAPPRPAAAVDDGGPPRISTLHWLWFSAGSFLRWLRKFLD